MGEDKVAARNVIACAHCWHSAEILACMPPIQVYRCCHCGTKQQEQRRVVDPERHGPYLV